MIGPEMGQSPCHQNQEEFVVYIEAEQDGLNGAIEYPELHAQLQSCNSCYRLYTEVKELLEIVQRDTLVEPPVKADFVLPVSIDSVEMASAFEKRGHDGIALEEPTTTFIDTSAQVQKEQDAHAVLWTFNRMGQLLVALSADLLNSFQPSPQTSYLKTTVRELFTIQSPNIADDLTVTISAHTVRRNPEQCTLAITADIPSRNGWPNLGGTTVTLLLEEEEAATELTDAFGTVVFTEIACTSLAKAQLLVHPGSLDKV